jgi:hypothetical protein
MYPKSPCAASHTKTYLARFSNRITAAATTRFKENVMKNRVALLCSTTFTPANTFT